MSLHEGVALEPTAAVAKKGRHQTAGVSAAAVDVEPEAFPRLARLRGALIEARYGLCTEKAEHLTAYFRAHARTPLLTRLLAPLHFALTRRSLASMLARGRTQSRASRRASIVLQTLYARLDARSAEPVIVAYARGLAHVLANVPLRIYDDELIVGNLTSHRVGAAIHPDFGGMLLLPELHDLATRRVNPLVTNDEQIGRLEKEILPFWFTRSVMARAPVLAEDPDLQGKLVRGREMVLTQFAGISHVTPDYPLVLTKGFEGILADVEAAQARAADESRAAFYGAAAIVARAAIAFGARWSEHCAHAAAREADPQRASELRDLSAIFAQVPARPARTLHEALQSVFLTHVLLHQESFQHGVSFGRMDQYLYPYYIEDRTTGRLTRERAVELLGCFLAKAAEQAPLFNSMATEFFSGLSSASGITLGGCDATGRDASNALSVLFLDAYDRMRLRQPNLHLRLGPDTPWTLRERAYEVLKKGGGMPALFNDTAVIPAVEALGATHEDACDYSIVGCVEWGVPRKSFPAAGAAFLSLPSVLDDVLHRAAAERDRDWSMDALLDAFRDRLAELIGEAVTANNAIERAHALYRPTPLLSALIEGCIDSGRDVTGGGARYDTTGIQGVGLADVADSLAAIDALVFTERRVRLADLVGALDADFAGHEELHRRLLNKTPKYGRDDEKADRYATAVARMYCELARAHQNVRGGRYAPGFWAMTTHVGFGRRLGALPSGRRRGAPLADGISPVNGTDCLGPTASLRSAAKVCGTWIANGAGLNEKLAPWLVRSERGSRLMDGLVRGYFASGGQQVQYNVLDRSLLLDAKLHPERYRDLVVRVSGYSAYFNDLTDEMKDDIIARTEHGDAAPAMPGCQVTAECGESS